MQINIEINDTQFKTLMEKSIEDLPKEKIQEIILEGIKNYLTTSDTLTKLFIASSSAYYNSSTPTTFLKDILMRTTPTEELNDIRDEMLNTLRVNYDKILREALTQTLINGIINCNGGAFREAVSMILHENI